jgi:hypothetical protein
MLVLHPVQKHFYRLFNVNCINDFKARKPYINVCALGHCYTYCLATNTVILRVLCNYGDECRYLRVFIEQIRLC